jgi:anion-transporting  ArsA/GET3 family ATPase
MKDHEQAELSELLQSIAELRDTVLDVNPAMLADVATSPQMVIFYAQLQLGKQKQLLESLEQVITANEAAQLYKRDMSTIRRACINGWIPARKSGRVWLILRSDAQARWGK